MSKALDRAAALSASLSTQRVERLAARNRFAALAAEVSGDDPPAAMTEEEERAETADYRARQRAALAAGDLTLARELSFWGWRPTPDALTPAQGFAWWLLGDAERAALESDRVRRSALNRATWARLSDDQRRAVADLTRKRRESALLAGVGDGAG